MNNSSHSFQASQASQPPRKQRRVVVDKEEEKTPHNAPRLMRNEMRLKRFVHPSHSHKLFRNIVRNMAIFCDNLNCKRRLHNNEVTYVCFRCDYDLCSRCYMLPTESGSVTDVNESDEDINEDVLFIPERFPVRAKSVRLKNDDDSDDCDEGSDMETENTRSTGDVDVDLQTLNDMDPRRATITFESQEYDDGVTQNVNELLSSVAANVHVLPHVPSNMIPLQHDQLIQLATDYNGDEEDNLDVLNSRNSIPPPPVRSAVSMDPADTAAIPGSMLAPPGMVTADAEPVTPATRAPSRRTNSRRQTRPRRRPRRN